MGRTESEVVDLSFEIAALSKWVRLPDGDWMYPGIRWGFGSSASKVDILNAIKEAGMRCAWDPTGVAVVVDPSDKVPYVVTVEDDPVFALAKAFRDALAARADAAKWVD